MPSATKNSHCVGTTRQITYNFKMKKNRPVLNKCSFKDEVTSMTSINNKHQVTPIKVMNKTLKGKDGEDVHSICLNSAPLKPLEVDSSSPSPSSSFASGFNFISSSQDPPDITWDLFSPKQQKRYRRIKGKASSLSDLLKNVCQSTQVPACESQFSVNCGLVDKWITEPEKNLNAVTTKNFRSKEKEINKKLSTIIDMNKLLETLQPEDGSGKKNTENKNEQSTIEADIGKYSNNATQNEVSKPSSEEQSVSFNSDPDECDSTEELWGDGEETDSFILKATQDFECCLISTSPSLTKTVLPESVNSVFILQETIPVVETCSSETKEKDLARCSDIEKSISIIEKTQTNETKTFNMLSGISASSSLSEKSLIKLESECDFNFEDDNWSSSCLLDDEILSSIPEDALVDPNIVKGVEENSARLNIKKNEFSCKIFAFEKADGIGCNKIHKSSENVKVSNSDPVVSDSFEEKEICFRRSVSLSENHNLSDSDVFDDDNLLYQPELWSWADEEEIQPSISKRTPEEIAKKRAEALEKLRRKQENIMYEKHS